MWEECARRVRTAQVVQPQQRWKSTIPPRPCGWAEAVSSHAVVPRLPPSRRHSRPPGALPILPAPSRTAARGCATGCRSDGWLQSTAAQHSNTEQQKRKAKTASAKCCSGSRRIDSIRSKAAGDRDAHMRTLVSLTASSFLSWAIWHWAATSCSVRPMHDEHDYREARAAQREVARWQRCGGVKLRATTKK